MCVCVCVCFFTTQISFKPAQREVGIGDVTCPTPAAQSQLPASPSAGRATPAGPKLRWEGGPHPASHASGSGLVGLALLRSS